MSEYASVRSQSLAPVQNAERPLESGYDEGPLSEDEASECGPFCSAAQFLPESRALVSTVKETDSVGGDTASTAEPSLEHESWSGVPAVTYVACKVTTYNLGMMYAKGAGVQQDKAKALELYAKASAAGHVKATYNLGLMYQRGEGVEEDSARAAELYEQAHAKGYPKATHNLAMMYDRGLGVEKDSVRAAELFQQLAAAKAATGRTRP